MKSKNMLKSGALFLIIALVIGSVTMLILAEKNEAVRPGTGEGIQRNQSQMEEHECDCDGDCFDEDHEGKQPVKVSGAELRAMKIVDIAALWEVDSNLLLDSIITNLKLKDIYTLDNTIDEIRLEYRFSPNQIKIIADSLKVS